MGKGTLKGSLTERNYSISSPVPKSSANDSLVLFPSESSGVEQHWVAPLGDAALTLSGLTRKGDSEGGRFWFPGQLLSRRDSRRGWVNAKVCRVLPM